MAEFTLYTVAMSRGQIARWALHETGADYEHVMFDWDARPDAFLAANPMKKVPTLVHHRGEQNNVVTEAAAICHYLAETHPASGLLPDADQRAAYFRWLFFAAGPLEQAIVSKALGWEVPENRVPMAGFGSFELTVSTLENWFQSNDYVCGDRFTIADVYVGSQVDWGISFGTLPKLPAFESYANRFRTRDAYLEAKGIDAEIIAETEKTDG